MKRSLKIHKEHNKFIEYRVNLIDERRAIYNALFIEFSEAKERLLDSLVLLNEAKALTEETFYTQSIDE